MLQTRIASLTNFVEEKYIPYFNYYFSYGLIIARSVILALLVIASLIQVGITFYPVLKHQGRKHGKTLAMLMVAGLNLAGALILMWLSISRYTQLIALLMLAVYLLLIVYQKKRVKAETISCKPGRKCCLCPCRKCFWVLMVIGYIFVLFIGWLFLLE
jgi:hypothetical protein